MKKQATYGDYVITINDDEREWVLVVDNFVIYGKRVDILTCIGSCETGET